MYKKKNERWTSYIYWPIDIKYILILIYYDTHRSIIVLDLKEEYSAKKNIEDLTNRIGSFKNKLYYFTLWLAPSPDCFVWVVHIKRLVGFTVFFYYTFFIT